MHPSRAEVAAVGYQYMSGSASIGDRDLVVQADAIREFCRRRGWTLVAMLRDVEAGSARAAARPALTNAIDRIRSGEASCLVVADLSQLCPSVADLIEILEAIETLPARLVSLDPPFDTGTPVGGSVGRILARVSDWERERRAGRTAAARARAASGREVPLALRRRIVRMRHGGMTLQAIADQLNAEGVPTVRGGAMWRPSSVQATLGYRRPGRWRPPGDGS
jgi:DNA invertase Pin-like site-specific DNA recombinase